MRISTTLLTFSWLASHLTTAAYTLQDDYNTQSFFSMFDFFTADDPTHGYVNFVDFSTAMSSGLAGTKNGQIYMGVDTTNVASGRGRNSVRLNSKKHYDAGSLIVLDIAHMPGSICGTWPAFWTTGPSWPSNGEIDIMEGVNTQSANHYAIHTTSGCSISNTGAFSGSIQTPNCDVNAGDQPKNAGCGIWTSDTSSYGDGFNAGQGGVYATEFTNSAISIWFFTRSSIPADITSGSPNPRGWGKPHASFGGSSCNVGQFVKQQQIVLDTTFCGDWASGVWSTDATCSAKASTCQDFVQNNPSAFKEAYWSINSLKVYSGSGSEGGQPGGSGSASQQPPVAGGAPTAQPSAPGQLPFSSAPGGGFPQPSFSAGAPPPAPSAPQGNVPQLPQPQPQQSQPAQSWAAGNNLWGNANGGPGWDAGQFYGASTAGVAAPAAATAAAPPAANTNGNAANAPANAGADSTTSDTDATNAGTEAYAYGNIDPAAPNAAPQAPQAPQSPPASPSTSAPPSRAWRGPWKRPSWMGRYETVSAMSSDDFHKIQQEADSMDDKQKREVEEQDKDPLDRRDIEMVEAHRRREEKERRHRHEHQHLHVGMRKKRWWRS